MKKIYVFTILLMVFYFSSFSQSCLPDSIIFNKQNQIDSFSINYPNCSEIIGDVSIISQPSQNITNLNGLSQLQSINGGLKVKGNNMLNSFSGMENLEIVGGDIEIVENGILTNFEGLNNLSTIGGGLDIIDNYGLNTINGLENLTSVGGDIIVQFNHWLLSLDGFQGLTNHAEDIRIVGNAFLPTIAGLENLTNIEGNIFIQGNLKLLNLVGLDDLVSVGKGVVISSNPLLNSLNGLEVLTSIDGSLEISSNPSLMNINNLENLTYVGESITLKGDILDDISGIRNIDMVDLNTLSIHSNSMLSYCHYTNICNYLLNGGNSSISMNAIGCNSKKEIENLCLTSISEFKENKIEIFPNPVSDYIFIKKEKPETLEYQITDVNGRILMNGELIDEIHNITFAKINSGIYFIKIINLETREYIVEKLIKL